VYLKNVPGNPLGETRQITQNKTNQGTLGFKADLAGTWKLDGYAQKGQTLQNYIDVNGTRVDRLFFTMDAVADANGNPVCRVSTAAANPQYYKLFSDCVPINLFGGWNNISPQAAAYVSGPTKLDAPTGVQPGFFAWVDGAPAEGYRAPRLAARPGSVTLRPSRRAPIGILTGPLGAQVVEPLVRSLGRDDVRVVTVANEFFGGNIGVTGLLVGEDIARVLDTQPADQRYLLPDVCLSKGAFLDGTTPEDLPDIPPSRRTLHASDARGSLLGGVSRANLCAA